MAASGDAASLLAGGGSTLSDRRRHRRLVRGLLAIAILALTATVLGATPAEAQDPPDPYGGTTTTVVVDPRILPVCDIGLSVGLSPGQSATARVRNVPPGSTVRILLGGIEVGRGTAPLAAQSAGAPVVFGGAALGAQAATTTLEIRFTVPADLAPGTYLLAAVGADFTIGCGPNPDGTVDVLAATEVAGDGATDSGEDGSGVGALPVTGIQAALLVAIAVAALVIGRALLAASRRRRAAVQDRSDRDGSRRPVGLDRK